MQDHLTWCGSTSWIVSNTITRSQWPTFWETEGQPCPDYIFCTGSVKLSDGGWCMCW